MSVLGQLAKVAKAKPLRSTLDEAVEALARPKGTGAEFLREIEKTKGVKPTEIKERGIDKVLASMPKVNKEEIVKAIQSKANPPIEEKILGGVLSPELQVTKDALDSKFKEFVDNIANAKSQYEEGKISYGELRNTVSNNKIQLEALNSQIKEINKTIEPTKYEEHTIPNGNNYREILLKLPEKVKYDLEGFRSSHFSDPNILAHMRVSDRVGPNGEKVLHLEELQSDWHQKGRSQGYKEAKEPVHAQAYDAYIKDLMDRYHNQLRKTYGDDVNLVNVEKDPTKIAETMGELDTLQDNFARMYQERTAQNVGVPDAPFKKNWHEVALKKLINYATENGYDKIAITPGAEQANRYSLAKHINELHLSGTNLTAYDHNGNAVIKRTGVLPEDLPELIGKEATEKLLAQQPQGTLRSLIGQNLEVGGEGMKGFYDKILPDYLNKLGSPHGAQVKMHSMPSNPQLAGEFNNMLDHVDLTPEMFKALPVEQQQKITSDWTQKTSPSLHTFDLTPSLKNEVTQKGLPLYQQVGIPLGGAEAVNLAQPEPEMKRGGSVSISSNPDTMFMELADRKLAGGGAIRKIAEKLGTKIIPMAEAEANKAKFLEPSQVKEVLYRGQRRAPKPNKFITTQDRATPSFTTDPEVANVYSQQLGWDIAHGSGSTSVPVHVQMEKPFDIRKLGEHLGLDEFVDQMDHDLTVPTHPQKLGYEDLADILYTLDNSVFKGSAKHAINATNSKGYKIRGFDQLADEIISAGQKKNVDRILYDLLPEASVDAYALADNPYLVKNLKKLGYDSIIHKDVFDAGMPYYKGDPSKIQEGYDAENVIDAYRPLHQNKIKSAIGNQGTYDTTNPDITKKRGGAVQVDRNYGAGGAITKLTKLLAEAPELSHTVRGLYKAEAPELSGLIDKVQTPNRQSVIPMPNRWFTKPKENPHVQPLVEKVLQVNNMKREDFHSGAFVDPKTGLILDNQIHNDVGVAIDPITNRPVMTSGGVTGMESLPRDQGSFTNSNLLKQGKYKPTGGDSILDELGFIATVDKAGMGHAYGLGTDYASPVLLNNLGTGSNPTLRPRSVGDVFGVGDIVGQMQINKNSPVHDVYEKLLVAPKGSDVEGVKLSKAKGGAIRKMANGGGVPSMEYEPEQVPVDFYKHGNKMMTGDADVSMGGMGLASNVGDDSVNLALNSSDIKKYIGDRQMMNALMANYAHKIGDTKLMANVMTPLGMPVKNINLMASTPIGEGTATLGAHGSHGYGQKQLNALSANYNLPLEHGNLNANISRSLADKKNTVNLNYVMPFKDGGSVNKKRK